MRPLGAEDEGSPPDGGKWFYAAFLWRFAKVWVAKGRFGWAKEAFQMLMCCSSETGMAEHSGSLALLRPLRSEGGVSALRSAHNKSLQLDVGFAAAAELWR